jgi:hypothetical protein
MVKRIVLLFFFFFFFLIKEANKDWIQMTTKKYIIRFFSLQNDLQ